MATDRTLTNLIQALRDRDFVRKLLLADRILPEIPTNLNEIQWEMLPPYYPTPLPRCSFRLHTSAGDYFLKLNADVGPIRREGNASNILTQKNNAVLNVPRIIDMELCPALSDQSPCAWLLREWIDAQPAIAIDLNVLAKYISEGLVYLHTFPVTSGDVQQMFAVALPEERLVLEHLRQRRRKYFDTAIEVCSSRLREALWSMQAQVDEHPFSPDVALIHGDLHMDNIKFQKNEVTGEVQLLWVDWEEVTLDHPLSDLANFILYENFSPLSLKCLEDYLLSYNQQKLSSGSTSRLDTWLLASVWLARTLGWRLRTSPTEYYVSIENEALSTLGAIAEAISRERR
jgi:hypothetical protein